MTKNAEYYVQIDHAMGMFVENTENLRTLLKVWPEMAIFVKASDEFKKLQIKAASKKQVKSKQYMKELEKHQKEAEFIKNNL